MDRSGRQLAGEWLKKKNTGVQGQPLKIRKREIRRLASDGRRLPFCQTARDFMNWLTSMSVPFLLCCFHVLPNETSQDLFHPSHAPKDDVGKARLRKRV